MVLTTSRFMRKSGASLVPPAHLLELSKQTADKRVFLFIRRLHLQVKYERIPPKAWDELQLKVLQARVGR